MSKMYIKPDRQGRKYGKKLKDFTIGKGKEPCELKGQITENYTKYFILKVKDDEYSQLRLKSVSIPKSECLMEKVDDRYRVLIPMWLHDRLCRKK